MNVGLVDDLVRQWIDRVGDVGALLEWHTLIEARVAELGGDVPRADIEIGVSADRECTVNLYARMHVATVRVEPHRQYTVRL